MMNLELVDDRPSPRIFCRTEKAGEKSLGPCTCICCWAGLRGKDKGKLPRIPERERENMAINVMSGI